MTSAAGPASPGPASPQPVAVLDAAAWQRLHDLAVEAMGRAYAPYSGFPVGAAALVDDGRLVSGCNVENAGYGVTLCAECGLVSELVRTGGGTLVAFVCVDARAENLAPCGRCRQLLSEHAHPGMLLAMPGGLSTIDQVLPDRFSDADLAAVRTASAGPAVGGAASALPDTTGASSALPAAGAPAAADASSTHPDEAGAAPTRLGNTGTASEPTGAHAS